MSHSWEWKKRERARKEKEMNIIILTFTVGIGWLIGSIFSQPMIGMIVGLVLGAMVVRTGREPLDKDTVKAVKVRTNSYLAEVWAVLPALKRIEAYDAPYALNNLQEIFNLHFPQELQDEIVTSEEIMDLGKIIITSEVKPLMQIKAFKRYSKRGLFSKNMDAVATVLHAGRVYARAGATPAMMHWLEAWAHDIGVNPDIAYRGYLAEITEQDNGKLQRLITGEVSIDDRLDQIPKALGDRAQTSTHNMVSRNTLYAEYRKSAQRFNSRAA